MTSSIARLGESALHVALVALLAVLLRAGPRLDPVVVVAPLAFVGLLAIDELAYHRPRVQQREHVLHTVGTLAAAAMLASFVARQLVARGA